VEFDALLRPGNSGGVLANDQGEIIGMNTLRELDQSGAATGPSYAIGAARLQSLLPQLTDGVSTVDRVGWNLEVRSAGEIAEFDDLDISPYRQAVRVTGVRTGTQAYKADVRTGDYIIEIEGERVRDIGDVCNVLTAASSGDQLRFRSIYWSNDGEWYDDTFKLKLK
jgi:S1-C subfamily serine protease